MIIILQTILDKTIEKGEKDFKCHSVYVISCLNR